jgi:hypothetical protein
MYNRQTQWSLDFSPFEPVIKTTDIHPEGAILLVVPAMIRSNVHARKSIRIHDSKQYFALQREIYD